MNPSSLDRALRVALLGALDHLKGIDDRPVSATADLAALRSALGRELNEEPIEADRVVDELLESTRGGIVGSAGGRFFAWVIGGSLPAALAADWLTSAWDQNAALYACGPAAAVVEEVSGKWLKELLGIPPAASFALVTGCQMAHATCLAAARNGLLARRNWDVERKGLAGAPPIRILTSSQMHGSFQRAVRLVGLGMDHVEDLGCDPQGKLEAGALRAALERHRELPTLVLLQAGDVNTGVFDDFGKLIPIAHEFQAWVHIDGAFGLWANATPRFRHLLEGASQADSWATDGHKWLNVPYDSGYAFIADAAAHRRAMSLREHPNEPEFVGDPAAPYLVYDDDARDQIDWNPEFSRRARGFSTYAALRQLGRQGVAELVERCCDCAGQLVGQMGELPGVEVLWRPIINQGLVRFLDPAPNAADADHDRRTDEVIAAILADGGAFFGGTTWRGRRAMRVSVSSWRTTEADVAATVATVRRVLEKKAAREEEAQGDSHSPTARGR